MCTVQDHWCGVSGLYNATKTLFCKMRVQILYWEPEGVFIYPENFRSLTDHIFQFKFWLWLSGLLNCTIDSDIKVLNHTLLTLASDHDEQKTKPSYIHNWYSWNIAESGIKHNKSINQTTHVVCIVHQCVLHWTNRCGVYCTPMCGVQDHWCGVYCT